jgi:hypothetical protein
MHITFYFVPNYGFVFFHVLIFISHSPLHDHIIIMTCTHDYYIILYTINNDYLYIVDVAEVQRSSCIKGTGH